MATPQAPTETPEGAATGAPVSPVSPVTTEAATPAAVAAASSPGVQGAGLEAEVGLQFKHGG